jgi:hypothetical protein
MSFADNSFFIKDSVTPANNYDGPLLNPATGLFNKLTFTRASSAWTTDLGNVFSTFGVDVPRVNSGPLGRRLLMEGVRTNLLTFSGDLTNAIWTKTNATVSAPGGNGPGGTAIQRLTEDSATGDHRAFNFAACTVSTSYAHYHYVKYAGRRYVGLQETTLGLVVFDLINGVINSGSGGSIQSVFGWPGWYRIAMVATTGGAQTTWVSQLRLVNDSLATNYTGDGVAAVDYGGSQLEAGAWPSSYIPTTTVSVTRAAEVCTLSGTLFNLTQTAGVIYSKNTFDGGSANQSGATCIGIDDGTANETAILYAPAGGFGAYVADGGVQQAFLSDLAVANNAVNKGALAYALNDFALVQNGRAAQVDGAGTLMTTTTLRIGNYAGGGAQTNGETYEIAFWGSRLSNAQLQAVTT